MKAKNRERYVKLGLKISYCRKLKGLTQEALAEKVDMNLATIGAIEAPNVARYPSLETVFNIADALEIPVGKLFTED